MTSSPKSTITSHRLPQHLFRCCSSESQNVSKIAVQSFCDLPVSSVQFFLILLNFMQFCGVRAYAQGKTNLKIDYLLAKIFMFLAKILFSALLSAVSTELAFAIQRSWWPVGRRENFVFLQQNGKNTSKVTPNRLKISIFGPSC